MSTIKTVGVKELKNRLSAYLQDVRRGHKILVTDRGVVVAELGEPSSYGLSDEFINPTVLEWLTNGSLTAPSRAITKLKPSSVKLPPGTVQKLIDDDRAE